MTEWISVKDRLPEKNEIVGYVFDGTIRFDVYYPGFCGSFESVNDFGFFVSEKNITHWMPLPELPKE